MKYCRVTGEGGGHCCVCVCQRCICDGCLGQVCGSRRQDSAACRWQRPLHQGGTTPICCCISLSVLDLKRHFYWSAYPVFKFWWFAGHWCGVGPAGKGTRHTLAAICNASRWRRGTHNLHNIFPVIVHIMFFVYGCWNIPLHLNLLVNSETLGLFTWTGNIFSCSVGKEP